jgi:putative FmdB family regulatory protein
MPIYEYQCEKCHHHLEALQKISDKPLRECPECGKHSLKRLLSAPLFRLAGSGWYETDFKSDKESRRNLAGKDEAPADSGGKAAGDKPESKPDKAVPEKSDKPEKAEKRTMVTKPVAKVAGKGRSKPAAKKPAAKRTAKRR